MTSLSYPQLRRQVLALTKNETVASTLLAEVWKRVREPDVPHCVYCGVFTPGQIVCHDHRDLPQLELAA